MQDETNFLTDEQYLRFINSIPMLPRFHKWPIRTRLAAEDMQLLFMVIHDGAFRVSEVLKLTPQDLIKDKQLISLEGTKGTKKSKGNQKREFGWIRKNAWDSLVAYSYLFKPDERMFKVSRQTVWKWAKEIGDIAGIYLLHENKDTHNMTVHTLRHTRAVSLVDKGMKVNELMKKLRHRSLEPTTTYLNVNIEKVRETEDSIDKR